MGDELTQQSTDNYIKPEKNLQYPEKVDESPNISLFN